MSRHFQRAPEPRISVITPTRNQSAFLDRAIRSVLDQGYANLEYFVIDGGSTDESPEIIRAHADRLAGWISRRDDGPADAINRALGWATGEIVAIVYGDDMLAPGSLARAAGEMTGDEPAEWLVGGVDLVDEHDRIIDRFRHHAPESFAAFLMYTSGMLPLASTFWMTDLIQSYGRLDASLECCFDYEFHCRLLDAGVRPRIIEQTLGNFRVHPMNKGTLNPSAFREERLRVAERYLPRLPWPQRLMVRRNLDARRREMAISDAMVEGERLPWAQVLRKPWWLADREVVQALLRRPRADEHAAA